MNASRADLQIQKNALRHFVTQSPIGRNLAAPIVEKASRISLEHPTEFTTEDAAEKVRTDVLFALRKLPRNHEARVAYRESLDLASRSAR